MTRTSGKRSLGWLGASVVALGLALCANAFAQKPAPRVVAGTEDMRLWSFGDCDRQFPYVDMPEHKECVQAVGSPEAKDARALRVCELSHQPNLEEIERCKGVYYANKEKAARASVAANALATEQAAASPETMRMVKAITTAAVEQQQAAVKAPAPAPQAAAKAPEPPAAVEDAESSSWPGPVGTVVVLAVVVGLGVNLKRRKQAQSA